MSFKIPTSKTNYLVRSTAFRVQKQTDPVALMAH